MYPTIFVDLTPVRLNSLCKIEFKQRVCIGYISSHTSARGIDAICRQHQKYLLYFMIVTVHHFSWLQSYEIIDQMLATYYLCLLFVLFLNYVASIVESQKNTSTCISIYFWKILASSDFTG